MRSYRRWPPPFRRRVFLTFCLENASNNRNVLETSVVYVLAVIVEQNKWPFGPKLKYEPLKASRRTHPTPATAVCHRISVRCLQFPFPLFAKVFLTKRCADLNRSLRSDDTTNILSVR